MIKYFGYDDITNEYIRREVGLIQPENVRFVSPNFNDASPYFSTIQAAINDLTQGLVIVYPGIYPETVTMADNIHIYGHKGAVLELDGAQQGFIFDGLTDCSLLGYFNINYQNFSADNFAISIINSAKKLRIDFESSENGVCFVNLSYADSTVTPAEIDSKFNTIGLFKTVSRDNQNVFFKRINIEAEYIKDLEVREFSAEYPEFFKIKSKKINQFSLYRLNSDFGTFKYDFEFNINVYTTAYSFNVESCNFIRFINCVIIGENPINIENSDNIYFRDCSIFAQIVPCIRYSPYSTGIPYNKLYLHGCLLHTTSSYVIVNPASGRYLNTIVTASAFNNPINLTNINQLVNDYITEGNVEAF